LIRILAAIGEKSNGAAPDGQGGFYLSKPN